METSVHRAEIIRHRLEISPKGTDMRLISQFQARIADIFTFVAPGRPLNVAIPKTAKFLGLGVRRVRALHAGEARSIGLDDDDALFEAEVKISEHILTKEVERHANRLELAAFKLAAESADTHRDRIARFRDLARRARALFDRKREA